jgi:hypothetical protein
LWANRKRDRWDVVVPTGLRPGKYLVRHEIVDLELIPVQFYPNFAQVEVDGEAVGVSGEEYLVKFPGAYNVTGKCVPWE